jgi:hypothetical protein
MRVNGVRDYLPAGIQRDTPWSIQGDNGVLKKGGVTLLSEPGFRAYLLAEPKSGTYTAYNPIPDPIYQRFVLPGGQQVLADGRLGMTRLRITPAAGKAWIDYQVKPEQKNYPTLATAMVLVGFAQQPTVVFNGTPLKSLRKTVVEGKTGWIVPLATKVKKQPDWVTFCDIGALQEMTRPHNTFFHDWHIVGPFDNFDYAGQNFQLKEFGPEKGYDPKATYQGVKAGEKGAEPAAVQWRPLLKDGQPAISASPTDLLGQFTPNRAVIAYLAATILSDRDQTVQLLTGGDERLAVWVNGQRVVYNKGYRLAFRDQDRVFITLKKGENPVLIKVAHGHESWRLYFRLADANGLPLREGVRYKGARRTTPAHRDPEGEKVDNLAQLPPLF